MRTISNYKGHSFEIETYFSFWRTGYGHWTIVCDVTYKGNKKSFNNVTTDSQFIDQLSEMRADGESWNDIQKFCHEKCFYDLEESILEWVEEL